MNTMRWFGVGLLSLVFFGVTMGHGLTIPAIHAANSTPTAGNWSCTGWRGSGGMMGGNWTGMNPEMMGGNRTGMMEGDWNDSGMMWGTMGNMGMMSSYAPTAQPISEDQARQSLATFAADCGAGVQIGEVMAFASNYYAQLVDASGAGYAEVLVDRYTGVVYPEPGPDMMWNTHWGLSAGARTATKYDLAAAQDLAATFLRTYLPGATVLDGQAFPGYDTFDFGRGQVEGMLSVNAATGEIWVHTWHGPALPASN